VIVVIVFRPQNKKVHEHDLFVVLGHILFEDSEPFSSVFIGWC